MDARDGYGWDSHIHSDDVKNHLLPTFDQTCATLLTDLDERGMLDETLVVAIGEMGRTPIASPRWGRAVPEQFLFLAARCAVRARGGSTYGASDKDAAHPIDHPVSPERLAATIYYRLGIDPELRLPDQQGRPSTVIVDGARPVLDLFT